MTRLNLLLLLALVATALALVRTAYDARRLFADIHRAEQDGERLTGEHRRLEAERELQATNLRVERTARERLQMRSVTPAVTMYEARASAPLAPAAPAPSVARARP